MEIYVHPTCTSCRKAEAQLAESGVAMRRRDYFKNRFDQAELAALLARAGLAPSDVLSKRSRAYKNLQLEGKDLDDDSLLALMIEHPTLLKRPLILGKGGATVGFNAGKISDLVAKEG